MRLAIITTHPIQYYAPVFKLLHEKQEISIKVFYTWGEKALEKFDPGFGKTIAWDIPVLEGYPYEWVKNTSTKPGSHHFKGIINPHLITQIEVWQADAILVFGWAYHSHLKALRYFKNKIPVYFRGDSTLLDTKKGIKSVLRSLFLKWVYRHVDHAFYVGANNKAYFKKHGLKEWQLSFAPHAIDNERFAADRTTEAVQLRKNLGIDPGDTLVLFAGKLEDKKSPGLLLDAFITLKAPKTHLLFVGNGILEIELKTNASKNHNVHFMEFQNQSVMPVIYLACDLFCLPSKGPGETWGLAVNEAMAAGKPVLVSDKCGCAIDLVTNNNGIIFNSENVEDLTLNLQKLLGDHSLLNKYGMESKALIKEWSFANIAVVIENKLTNEKI
ncbi:glycosyltransferase family 4 protein [Mucilaginibacter dorajii]|uniref:Glycosyl transferase family 1 domain-containing protein n=1 Tax=Mucilaginibacter dorajii TaxID=692994 RepID=A0ABP7Q3H0_9SPHI|nr:glycosyltransferase family 4 protein [Mucilaginibacter dorajii]MCS3732779.1 glycosyltransferase involved in cell wall biosynthesis [Mucilaginibacter dorajii]